MMNAAADPIAITAPDDALLSGDAAATREDWPTAVSAWRSALSGPRRNDAIARLQWFIAWRTGQPLAQSGATRRPRKPLALFVWFLECCLFTIAAVFVTEDLSGTAADLSMVVAWILIVAAAVFSLLYARYSDPDPTRRDRRSERQVRSLAERAGELAKSPVKPRPHH